MRHQSLSLALSPEKPRCLLIVCAISILCLSQAALAQSGRRQVRRDSPSPAAPVEAKTEREVTPTPAKPAPVASLIVGGDRFGSSLMMLSSYVDTAVDACVERLRKARSLAVTAGGNMTRKEAIDQAKKEKDAHVVWLEMRVEGDRDMADVVIEYSVFMPQSAKVKTHGRVYLDGTQRGNGRIGVGVPSVTRRLPLQYLVQEGGRSVADRVLDKFHVSLPD